jgi:uncharacterized NAD(P)/FAD-binding protein YdhS
MTFDVAVVGGGFSGTMVAAQLARKGLASALIDGSGRIGRGIAYSTREPAHVLNVRAEVMSAWPEDQQDFARRIESEGGSAKDFVERRRFGRYMDGILNEATAAGLVAPVDLHREELAIGGDRAVADDDGGLRDA